MGASKIFWNAIPLILVSVVGYAVYNTAEPDENDPENAASVVKPILGKFSLLISHRIRICSSHQISFGPPTLSLDD